MGDSLVMTDLLRACAQQAASDTEMSITHGSLAITIIAKRVVSCAVLGLEQDFELKLLR